MMDARQKPAGMTQIRDRHSLNEVVDRMFLSGIQNASLPQFFFSVDFEGAIRYFYQLSTIIAIILVHHRRKELMQYRIHAVFLLVGFVAALACSGCSSQQEAVVLDDWDREVDPRSIQCHV